LNFMDIEFLLEQEIIQRREEGCEVIELERLYNSAKLKSPSEKIGEYEKIYQELEKLLPAKDFPFQEPSGWEEIRACRPSAAQPPRKYFPEEILFDKIYGAWLGRCAGCLLGKPVEGWPRSKIESYLEYAGETSLNNYFPKIYPLPSGFEFHSSVQTEGLRGEINYALRDDDLDYTILGLHILEEHGIDFSSQDIANEWLSHLPYSLVYTAERVAYRNLVNGIKPPFSASYRNPYREWIGAQIRADIWGYVAPGLPEVAAEFAYRDAVVSHMKNGIYGEIWVSAMLAAAFVTNDLYEVINYGLSEIPRNCRLAKAIKTVLRIKEDIQDWDRAWQKVIEKYGSYNSIHTINNALLVLLGLLYGEGDYEKAITLSVRGGLDADCNGATAGSLMGAILGAQALPEKWISPLNDKVKSIVTGYNDCRISLLADRTLKLAKQVLASYILQ